MFSQQHMASPGKKKKKKKGDVTNPTTGRYVLPDACFIFCNKLTCCIVNRTGISFRRFGDTELQILRMLFQGRSREYLKYHAILPAEIIVQRFFFFGHKKM